MSLEKQSLGLHGCEASMYQGSKLLLLLLCGLAGIATVEASHRFVITFHDGNALEQYSNSTLLQQAADSAARVDKWYGRRIVLRFEDTQKAQQFWDSAAAWQEQVPNMKLIEEDNLLLANMGDAELNASGLVGTKNDNNFSKVVAVLDTGLSSSSLHLYRHLLHADGYDFISSEALALDGDGRDSNWTDPGDANPPDCYENSWHGTLVTNVLAAAPELNEMGFSGVAPNAVILPVRVLGACKTGYASDVADAIVWAAGGRIDSLDGTKPDRPAEVILMAFAGYAPDGCPDFLQSAVDLAVSNNITLVAAAGNSYGQPASHYAPGNCRGVVSVGALDDKGNVASYSSVNATVNAFGGPMQCLNENGHGMQFCTGTSFAAATLTRLEYSVLLNQNSNNSNIILHASEIPPCNAGYFQSSPTECTQCPSGTYQDAVGQSSCKNCPAGSSVAVTYDWGNNLCPAYTDQVWEIVTSTATITRLDVYYGDYIGYKLAPGVSWNDLARDDYKPTTPIILSSAVNYIALRLKCSGYSVESVTSRLAYFYGPSSGAKTCQYCPVGFCSTQQNSLECTQCEQGKYQNLPGTTQCQQCAAGTYSETTGMSACLLCRTGTYSTSLGASACTNCEAGKYSTSDAQSSCTSCVAGKYFPYTVSPAIVGKFVYSSKSGSVDGLQCPTDLCYLEIRPMAGPLTVDIVLYGTNYKTSPDQTFWNYVRVWDTITFIQSKQGYIIVELSFKSLLPFSWTTTSDCIPCSGNSISGQGASTCTANACAQDYQMNAGHTGIY